MNDLVHGKSTSRLKTDFHTHTGRKAAAIVPGAFLRGLIDQAVEGIALVDEDSVIIEWNAAMAKITGVQRRKILYKDVHELSKMMSMDPPLLGQTVTRMLGEKANFRDALVPDLLKNPFEVRLLGLKHGVRIVQVKLFPVRVSKRVIVGALLEDVTERRNTERLLQDSRKKLQNLALSLLAAREEERKNMAHEIHDELGQSLTALKMDVLWLEKKLVASGGPIRNKLADMTTIMDHTLSAVQQISIQVRPRILDIIGLAAALKWLCEDFRRRAGLICKTRIGQSKASHPGAIDSSIYRIAQELLTNVARHAKASLVFVQFREFERTLRLTVRDDGIGITPEQASATESIGLIGIREQVRDLQGEFSVTGTRRRGTTARVWIPLRREIYRE